MNRAVLSDELIKRFCDHCAWVYRVWSTYRIVFDDNPNLSEFDKCHFAAHLQMTAEVSRDYLAIQICALHDPPVQYGRENLNLARVAEDRRWSEPTRTQLADLKSKMEEHAKQLRPARNRIVAHLDLQSFVDNKPLGAFPADEDKAYFNNLQMFVDVVHDAAIGGPHPLRVAMNCNDAQAFASAIVQHVRDREARGEAMKRAAGIIV